MRESSWFNLRAGRARLVEIAAEIAELHREHALLRSLLKRSGAEPKSGRGRRRRASGPTLASLLAAIIKAGPKEKAWTAGELADALAKKHPGRVPGENPSSLVSATLAQELRSKAPLFVARKARGKRAKLYRLA
jgi:hypothetical protein